MTLNSITKLPKASPRSYAREYTNFVYACHNCNHRKGNKHLPSPDKVAYGTCLEVLLTGRNTGKIVPYHDNVDGVRLIDELALDGEKITAMRRQIILSIRSHECHDRRLFLMWMGFPKDLPDLAAVRPQPKHNTRPEGVAQSWFRRNPLPEYYE